MSRPIDEASSQANVAELLAAVAARSPTRAALLRPDGSVAWTFGSLAAAAALGAARLQRAGIGPGDRVIVLVPGAGPAVVAAAAILWSGAVVVVPPRGPGGLRVLRAVAALDHRAVVASRALWLAAALVPELWRGAARLVTGRFAVPGLMALDGAGGSIRPPVARPRAAPAIVTYTTGTTGAPQPITRTHGVLRGQHAALDRLRPAEPGDLDIPGLPMLVLHNLARGVPSVLLPAGDPNGGWASTVASGLAGRVTTAAGFPALFEALVGDLPPGGLPALRAIHIGGAPVPVALVDRLRAAAPNAHVEIVYGATEAEPIASIGADDYGVAARAATPGDGICVGRPVPGLEVRLGPLPGAADRPWGRLEVRGARVVSPTDQQEAWLDVGDLARIDGHRRIWLLGRAVHAVDGIAPLVIEQVAESIDGVRAAAVIRVATQPGTDPLLVLEVGEQAPGSLVGRVHDVLAERGWRIDVRTVVRLPRERRSGTKIDYRELARMLSVA